MVSPIIILMSVLSILRNISVEHSINLAGGAERFTVVLNELVTIPHGSTWQRVKPVGVIRTTAPIWDTDLNQDMWRTMSTNHFLDDGVRINRLPYFFGMDRSMRDMFSKVKSLQLDDEEQTKLLDQTAELIGGLKRAPRIELRENSIVIRRGTNDSVAGVIWLDEPPYDKHKPGQQTTPVPYPTNGDKSSG